MIGQYLIDMVDEAGYLTGDLASVAEKLGAPLAEVEAVLGVVQAFDPPGVCARNLTECLAIQLKERDRFDPAMAALVGRLDLLAKRDLASLRRICGVGDEDLAEMIVGNPQPQSEARPRLRLDHGAADRARRLCAFRTRRRLHRRAELRHAAEDSGQPALSCRALEERQSRQRQDLSRRESAVRDLADARARSARQDHPQGRDRDRQTAGRLLRARRAASAPAQPQDHRRRHQHARVRRCRASPPTNTSRPAAASSN